jgi:(4S)-4-hydroxy-5-phosphonooxypentane-2,3-dione isomerase
MKGYVIAVEFEVAPPHIDEFLRLVIENGKASERDEPGCKRFDICRRRDEPNRIFLYEIYDDEAAFKAHVETPHFLKFRDATEKMVVGRKLWACDWLA